MQASEGRVFGSSKQVMGFNGRAFGKDHMEGGDSGRRVSVGGCWMVLGRKVWAAEQGTV